MSDKLFGAEIKKEAWFTDKNGKIMYTYSVCIDGCTFSVDRYENEDFITSLKNKIINSATGQSVNRAQRDLDRQIKIYTNDLSSEKRKQEVAQWFEKTFMKESK